METVGNLINDLNNSMDPKLNKKINHTGNVVFLTPDQKASEINQRPVLEPETEYCLTSEVDKQ